MTGQLNTTINGNPASCTTVADWLTTLGTHATTAHDQNLQAARTADAGWDGPASEAFWYALYDPRLACLDVTYTCEVYATALRDFADGLNSAMNIMRDAIDNAAEGGLEVQGPFILPPVLGATLSPNIVGLTNDLDPVLDVYAAYNAKVDVFNDCSDMVADARRVEYETHMALIEALGEGEGDPLPGPDESGLDAWEDAGTVVSGVSAYVEQVDENLAESLRAADRFAAEGRTFQRFALGKLAEMTPAGRALLRGAVSDLRGAEDAFTQEGYYRTRASQFARMLDHVPESVQTITRQFSHFASVYDPALNVVGALRGEQSWTEAAIRTGSDELATVTGARLGVQVGKFFGPEGAIIGGVVGAVAFSLGADKVVDELLPGEEEPDPFAQPKAEHRDPWPEGS